MKNLDEFYPRNRKLVEGLQKFISGYFENLEEKFGDKAFFLKLEFEISNSADNPFCVLKKEKIKAIEKIILAPDIIDGIIWKIKKSRHSFVQSGNLIKVLEKMKTSSTFDLYELYPTDFITLDDSIAFSRSYFVPGSNAFMFRSGCPYKFSNVGKRGIYSLYKIE